MKKNKRKQREACFLWLNLQDFQPGQKENTNSYFWLKSSRQMARTFQFPATLFLTLLSSIVWHWQRAEKKTHTAFASGHLGSPAVARSREALPVCLHATSNALKVKLDNFFGLNFVIMMYILIKKCNSGWKVTPFGAKLVSNKPCLYHGIFFATGQGFRRKMKNQWHSLYSLS